LKPKKDPSEDIVDFVVKEYFEANEWKTAYYSPPGGSWSIISFDLRGNTYRGFSPRDTKRPDLIMYKESQNEIHLFVAESKETISDFNLEMMKEYTANFSRYISNMFKDFRHKKEDNRWIDWNKGYKIDIKSSICFMGGITYPKTDWDNEIIKFENLIKENNKNNNVMGIVVMTDWKNNNCYIEAVNNKDPELISFLPNKKEILINYSTLQ